MDQNFVDTARFSTWKNRLAFNLIMPVFVISLLVFGWVAAGEHAHSLTRAIIPGYQKAELEIVRVAARSITLYLQDQVDSHHASDITAIEQDIFKRFIKPIKLLKSGDAWIYAPGYVVFDLSEDFPEEYRGKSMHQIFDIQKKMGASHFEEMAAAVGNSREGVGWYIWLPDKGKEIAAWTPVKVGKYTWSIGLSVPLPEILEQTGAGAQIRKIKLAMTIVTIAALIFLAGWGYGAWVKERMAQALQESRGMLQTVLDTIPQAICWKDRQLAYLGCNQNYTRMAGVDTFADLVGAQGQGKGLQAWDHDKFHDTDRSILKDGKSILHERHSRINALGNDVWLDTTRVPLYDAQNDIHGIMIMYADVTERVRIDEMMIQTEKMTSVGGLAAGMAHEINNPLAGMVQSANVIKSRLEDCDMPANLKAAQKLGISMEDISVFMRNRGIFRMIDGIQESGARMVDIVNSMLSFARKSDAGFSSHCPDELMDKTVAMAALEFDLKKQYDFQSIEIIKEYADDLPMLPCDGAKIQQVLLNILRNGSQAMQMGKTKSPRFTLRIYAEGSPEMVHMEIEDNGPGMDEEIRSKVFDPFFTTKPVGVGTGLGLSVSYFIITENHKGSMDVMSEPGKGSTFIIRLPIHTNKTAV